MTIRLVTLDLYQTLVYSTPDRSERLARVCAELGHDCRPDDFLAGEVESEELYTVENGRVPMHTRSAEEQRAFYASMYAVLLRAARLPHDPEIAERVRAGMVALYGGVEWHVYDDVAPTLDALRRRGLSLGIVSNTSVDATILCEKVGLCDPVDFIVSSNIVGCEKPCREIFQAALDRAGVAPEEAVHVGDQPRSDALGAVSIGMHALLLDRRGWLEHETEYERIASLAEIVHWIDARLTV